MNASSLPLAIIAAVARNGVIGRDKKLPWRLPSDLRHFKATTMGKPVIMGRRTYESIGRPLPGRMTIVVTRSTSFQAPGVFIAGAIEEALQEADVAGRARGAGEIMVAGGGELYRALMHQARRLYITEVDAAPAGDTLFPPIDPASWRMADRRTPARDAEDEAAFDVVVYERL